MKQNETKQQSYLTFGDSVAIAHKRLQDDPSSHHISPELMEVLTLKNFDPTELQEYRKALGSADRIREKIAQARKGAR